ncbi:MAG: glucosaminidase domain-containing protein [Bacteroidota bacterium]
MQKPRVNIQKVVANTKSLLHQNQPGLFSSNQNKDDEASNMRFMVLLLLSVLALIFILCHNIYTLFIIIKNVIVFQVRTMTLKKAITWSKLAVLLFVTCLLFKQEIGLSFDNSGIAFATKNEDGMLTSIEETNPFAPADPASLKDRESLDYIRKFAPIAIEEMRAYKIPASISLAQGLLESRAGSSRLAVDNNNHFGIKCFSRRCTKNHCSNYEDDHHKDFFRKYSNAEESWKDHSKFLMKDRYKELFQYGKDYRLWAQGLSEKGYATDKKYASKLIRIIEKYQLYSFDS